MSQLNVDTIKKADGTGNLTIPATTGTVLTTAGGVLTGDLTLENNGLYLGGTGAANYLDDYEEGVWYPTITPGGGGSITLKTTHDTAAYTKVGRVVTLQSELRIDSVSSPTGNILIGNLPFALASLPENSERGSGSVFIYDATGSPYYKTCATTISGSTFNLLCFPSGTYNNSAFQHTFGAGDELAFSVTYFTDS
jgi:hypothetical protein